MLNSPSRVFTIAAAKFLLINSNQPAQVRGMLEIFFYNKKARDQFCDTEKSITVNKKVYEFEAHKENDLLAVIRLPVKTVKGKNQFVEQEKIALIDELNKKYHSTLDYNFEKRLDTISQYPNHPDSALERSVPNRVVDDTPEIVHAKLLPALPSSEEILELYFNNDEDRARFIKREKTLCQKFTLSNPFHSSSTGAVHNIGKVSAITITLPDTSSQAIMALTSRLTKTYHYEKPINYVVSSEHVANRLANIKHAEFCIIENKELNKTTGEFRVLFNNKNELKRFAATKDFGHSLGPVILVHHKNGDASYRLPINLSLMGGISEEAYIPKAQKQQMINLLKDKYHYTQEILTTKETIDSKASEKELDDLLDSSAKKSPFSWKSFIPTVNQTLFISAVQAVVTLAGFLFSYTMLTTLLMTALATLLTYGGLKLKDRLYANRKETIQNEGDDSEPEKTTHKSKQKNERGYFPYKDTQMNPDILNNILAYKKKTGATKEVEKVETVKKNKKR